MIKAHCDLAAWCGFRFGILLRLKKYAHLFVRTCSIFTNSPGLHSNCARGECRCIYWQRPNNRRNYCQRLNCLGILNYRPLIYIWLERLKR